MEAAAASRNDAHAFCGPSTSSLFFLLPPCIILFAIDIAIRNSRRVKNSTALAAAPAEDVDENPESSILADPLRGLASKAQRVLNDFQEVERQLRGHESRGGEVPGLSLEIRRCRALSRRSYSDSALATSFRASPSLSLSSSSSSPSSKPQGISPAFVEFCDRLLEANRVRKEGEEVKTLKRSVKVSRGTRGSAAFRAFCDELLQSNKLWRKQREADELKEEMERIKRAQVAVITRAAKQMVLDVQKERMVEEFVRDVLKEAAESRQAAVDLRQEHEKETRGMVGAWRKEQGKMRREMERLHLAQEAKSLEQEISNELEDRLFERAYAGRDDGVEEEDGQEIEVGYASDAETCFEDMSMMSSSSTCVGTPLPSPSKRPHFRTSETTRKGSSPPRRRATTKDYVGFSFNPLFFPSKAGNEVDGPSRRSTTPVHGSPLRPRKDSAAQSTPLKTAWRV